MNRIEPILDDSEWWNHGSRGTDDDDYGCTQ